MPHLLSLILHTGHGPQQELGALHSLHRELHLRTVRADACGTIGINSLAGIQFMLLCNGVGSNLVCRDGGLVCCAQGEVQPAILRGGNGLALLGDNRLDILLNLGGVYTTLFGSSVQQLNGVGRYFILHGQNLFNVLRELCNHVSGTGKVQLAHGALKLCTVGTQERPLRHAAPVFQLLAHLMQGSTSGLKVLCCIQAHGLYQSGG